MAPFKSSLARSVGKLFGVSRGRDTSLRGFASVSRYISAAPDLSATGGTKSTFNGYTIHTFTSGGAFSVASGEATVEYVIVGGGGAGGAQGGGGGAGGYRTGTADVNGNLTVTVGPGATADPSRNATPPNGGTSSVNFASGTITSAGGGGGGARFSAAAAGGSGGGRNYHSPGSDGAGNTPPVSPPQGNDGARGAPTAESSGGGGGAGAAGGTGGDGVGGVGGAGVQVPAIFRNPTTTFDPGAQWYLAGGGGGSVSSTPGGTGGTGGSGGGGNANVTNDGNGTAGLTNTGGGGGGAPYTRVGGNGGTGIVLIGYVTPE